MAESAVIRVLSWNINGLKAKLKIKQLKKEERKTKLLEIFDQYDIVLLQETKIGEMKDDKDYNKNWEIITKALSDKYKLKKLKDQTPRDTADNQEEEAGGEEEEDEEEEEEEEGGEEGEDEKKEKETRSATMYMTYFNSRMKGVAILVNKPHTLLTLFSEGGYYAWVHVEMTQPNPTQPKKKYTFVSVYYHPDADNQICNLMTEISKGSEAFKGRLVIGGDFNTTLDPKLDATTNIRDHATRRKTLKKLLSKANMVDVWRKKHPEDTEDSIECKYTYKHHNGTESRLDYICMFENEVRYVESCEILNDIDLSDHSPVSLTLKYTDREQL